MSLLLVVDDDAHILELLTHFLSRAGHQVVAAASGHAALEESRRRSFDLVVLDVLLPGVDGREVCRRLRRDGAVPVLMLSALGELHHKLMGFDVGADDYLAKPFEPVELVARVKALLKRAGRPRGTEAPDLEGGFAAGGLWLEPTSLSVVSGAVRLSLPALEFALLCLLARSPGRLFSRDQLLASVWGQDFRGSDRTVDVYVNRVRTRLPEAAHGYRIASVRGVGYRFEVAS
jgi:DNA-binding response OmpR family regulator